MVSLRGIVACSTARLLVGRWWSVVVEGKAMVVPESCLALLLPLNRSSYVVGSRERLGDFTPQRKVPSLPRENTVEGLVQPPRSYDAAATPRPKEQPTKTRATHPAKLSPTAEYPSSTWTGVSSAATGLPGWVSASACACESESEPESREGHGQDATRAPTPTPT